MIVSQYQNYLEEEWIKDLRTNNKIWVDKEAILSLIKINNEIFTSYFHLFLLCVACKHSEEKS